MYKVSAKLELNGTPFKQWNNVSLKQTLNTLTSIDISLPNAGGLYTNLPFEDMPIKFYLGWDTEEPPLRFDGSMDDIDFNIQKSGASMGMSGRDFGKILFDQLSVDGGFKPLGNPIVTGYILDYIRSLNRNLSTPLPELFEQNLIDDSNSAFSYLFEYDKSIEALKKLCSYGNYNWQMLIDQNNNRQFSVRAPKELTDENAFHAFIVGSKDNYTDIPSEADIHHVTSLSIKKDFSYKKNFFKVFGAEGIEAIYPTNPPANPKHLLYTDEGITSSGDALAVAKRLYESKSAPKTLVDFGGVGVETLLVGDIIYVNDFKYGASTLPSHLFRVIEINDSISFGSGWNSTIKVADYVPTLFQIFDGTEGL